MPKQKLANKPSKPKPIELTASGWPKILEKIGTLDIKHAELFTAGGACMQLYKLVKVGTRATLNIGIFDDWGTLLTAVKGLDEGRYRLFLKDRARQKEILNSWGFFVLADLTLAPVDCWPKELELIGRLDPHDAKRLALDEAALELREGSTRLGTYADPAALLTALQALETGRYRVSLRSKSGEQFDSWPLYRLRDGRIMHTKKTKMLHADRIETETIDRAGTRTAEEVLIPAPDEPERPPDDAELAPEQPPDEVVRLDVAMAEPEIVEPAALAEPENTTAEEPMPAASPSQGPSPEVLQLIEMQKQSNETMAAMAKGFEQHAEIVNRRVDQIAAKFDSQASNGHAPAPAAKGVNLEDLGQKLLNKLVDTSPLLGGGGAPANNFVTRDELERMERAKEEGFKKGEEMGRLKAANEFYQREGTKPQDGGSLLRVIENWGSKVKPETLNNTIAATGKALAKIADTDGEKKDFKKILQEKAQKNKEDQERRVVSELAQVMDFIWDNYEAHGSDTAFFANYIKTQVSAITLNYARTAPAAELADVCKHILKQQGRPLEPAVAEQFPLFIGMIQSNLA